MSLAIVSEPVFLHLGQNLLWNFPTIIQGGPVESFSEVIAKVRHLDPQSSDRLADGSSV